MIRNTLLTIATRSAQFAAAAVIPVIITRYVGAAGQGVFSIVKNYVGILSLFLDLGISISCLYFVGNKLYKQSVIIANSIWASAAAGSAGILISFAIYNNIPIVFKEIDIHSFSYGIAVLPFILLFTYISFILLGLNQIPKYNILILSNSLLTLISSSIAAIYFRNISAVLMFTTISVIVCDIFLLYYLVRSGQLVNYSFDIRVYIKSVKWGFAAQAGNIYQFLNYRLDTFIISYFMGIASVGYYAIAVAVSESLLLITRSLSTVLISNVVNSPDKLSKALMTAKACRITLFINIIIVILCSVMADFAFPKIFGRDFTISVIPFLLLLPGTISLGITNILASYFIGIGEPKTNSNIALFTCIMTILLNITLVPVYGINGAAITSSIVYTVAMIITLYLFCKSSDTSIFSVIVLKKTDTNVASLK